MRILRDDNPKAIEPFKHIKPAPIFGPMRCFAPCHGTVYTCTLAQGHSGPHVSHALFKKVKAVWDERG